MATDVIFVTTSFFFFSNIYNVYLYKSYLLIFIHARTIYHGSAYVTRRPKLSTYVHMHKPPFSYVIPKELTVGA